FASRRRHTRFSRDWSSDVCSSDLMIKDNHIAACGSIRKAVQHVREQLGPMVKIEVETESEQEVIEAVEANADIIMFDNRSPEEKIGRASCRERADSRMGDREGKRE